MNILHIVFSICQITSNINLKIVCIQVCVFSVPKTVVNIRASDK